MDIRRRRQNHKMPQSTDNGFHATDPTIYAKSSSSSTSATVHRRKVPTYQCQFCEVSTHLFGNLTPTFLGSSPLKHTSHQCTNYQALFLLNGPFSEFILLVLMRKEWLNDCL